MKLKTHLAFAGNCEEALNTYKEAFGGDITFIFRKKEDPNMEVCEEDKEKISHMILQTEHFEIGAEDLPWGTAVVTGNNSKLVLVFDDLTKIRRVFDLLAQGGNVTMPLDKTFFCEAFGELTDRFGISWIIMMSDEEYMA